MSHLVAVPGSTSSCRSPLQCQTVDGSTTPSTLAGRRCSQQYFSSVPMAVVRSLSVDRKQPSETAKASPRALSSYSEMPGTQDTEVDDGSQHSQAGILDAAVHADGTWHTTNTTNKARAASPNKFPSASNPATTSAAAHIQGGHGSDDDVDAMAKGKGREQPGLSPAAALSSASAPPSPPSSSAPAPFRLAFLDKVAAPSAPRSQAISPYGSSHELYTTAKKYRLKASQPSWAPGPAVSASPAVASSSSLSLSKSPQAGAVTDKPVSRAPSTEVPSTSVAKLEEEESKHPEEHTQYSQYPERPLSPTTESPDTENSDNMGSARPSHARAQRRPSPLDMPAKRRRSNGTSFRAVKVEDTEDGTTFVIRSKTPPSEPIASSSGTQSSLSTALTSTSEISQRPFAANASESFAATANTHRAASPAQSIDLRSSVEDEDCGCFIEEFSTPNIRVPRNLPRPAIVQDMDLTKLEVDSSLKDIPLQYILDNVILQGPSLLSTVVESSIALPSMPPLASSSSSSGQVIPTSVAVRTPTRLLQDAAPPECVLAVSSDETSKIMFLPVHGLVLATSCKSFAGIAKPPRSSVQVYEEGEDTIHILPVVHIHIPNSSAFSRLIPFFYTQEAGSLLASLLPLGQLPALSLTAAQTSPSLLASSLAKVDQPTLQGYVHFNHAMWRTTVALGAGRDELWKVLQASWTALITALSIRHAETLVKPEESEA